jgi:hypothetical protein
MTNAQSKLIWLVDYTPAAISKRQGQRVGKRVYFTISSSDNKSSFKVNGCVTATLEDLDIRKRLSLT